MVDAMTELPPLPARCRSCGAALVQNAMVCRECGCVPVIENATASIQTTFDKARVWIQSGAKSVLANRFALLWIMALIPGIMATAFAALIYCVVMVFRRGSVAERRDLLAYSAIAFVALINLRLSYVLLHDISVWLSSYLDATLGWLETQGMWPRSKSRQKFIEAALQIWRG